MNNQTIKIKYEDMAVEFGKSTENYCFITELFAKDSYHEMTIISDLMKSVESRIDGLLIKSQGKKIDSMKFRIKEVTYKGRPIELNQRIREHSSIFFFIYLLEIMQKCINENGVLFVER